MISQYRHEHGLSAVKTYGFSRIGKQRNAAKHQKPAGYRIGPPKNVAGGGSC